MPIPNPVYGLMVPFLCVVTLPLAIFAGITTTLAFSVLMFRVMVVYLDIAISVVPQYLMGRSSTSTTNHGASPSQTAASSRHQDHYLLLQQGNHSPKTLVPSEGASGSGHNTPPLLLPSSLSAGHRSPTRASQHAHFASAPSSVMSPSAGRRSRRGSLGGNSAAASSVGTITPVKEEEGTAALVQDEGGANSTIVRDFEGVGGWRLASEDKAEDDDSDWANINSRLELPHERMRLQQQQQQQQQQNQGQNQGQNHFRTPSGHSGTVTPGEGSWLMMKNHRSRDGETVSVAADVVDRERDVNWGPGNHAAGPSSSGRTSISPNSSRVRIGQAAMSRSESYFPPTTSPKSARKGA